MERICEEIQEYFFTNITQLHALSLNWSPTIELWSISPTFYERICANILTAKKVSTKNVSAKKTFV